MRSEGNERKRGERVQALLHGNGTPHRCGCSGGFARCMPARTRCAVPPGWRSTPSDEHGSAPREGMAPSRCTCLGVAGRDDRTTESPMALAVVRSRALRGLEAPAVTVEVHLANGLPSFTLVGLADTEVKESRERVRAALQTSGLEFPHNKRVTVSLAPADLPKESGRFDLPIAIGILAAAGQLDNDALARYEFAGELSLGGELRPVHGALAMALALGRASPEPARTLVLPQASADESARCCRATPAMRQGCDCRGRSSAAKVRRAPTSSTSAAREPPSARSRSLRRAA